MTKRHSIAIAAIIEQRLRTENTCAINAAAEHGYDSRTARDFRANAGGVQLLACDLTDYLKSQNPRFDAAKFADAAGIGHLKDIHRDWSN